MDSLEERLLHYLSRPEYEPQDRSAIARGMALPTEERAAFRELIARWEAEKKLLRRRGARLVLAMHRQRAYTGTVRVQLRGGKRFFVPHEEGQRELARTPGEEVRIFISPSRSMGALDGDVVRARVQRDMPPMHRRRRMSKKAAHPVPEGDFPLIAQVEEVLERRCELWVGNLCQRGRQYYVRGDGRSAPCRILLSATPPPEAQLGMLVTVQPEVFVSGKGESRGRLVHVLGWPESPGVDMAALIHRYALRDAFDEEVLQETLRLPNQVDKRGREDWTQRCVVTIDPPSARDFDDAISVQRVDGGWELAVHIADVSYYVRPGSALDAEARRRGNSTYLPDRVLPMLPPRLCDDLCSLVQGEERLTVLCHMRLDAEGEVQSVRLARAVICSRRRLDYPAVLALLEKGESTGEGEIDAMLREASELAQLLRRKRFADGALNLDMPELRAVLDEQGRTVGFEKEESDVSHQLIEEFMLAANEQVAALLRRHRVPTIYRVHEEPAEDKWRELALLLREYQIPIGLHAGRGELVRVMEQIVGHPDESRLKVAVLRSMMRARYACQPLGHFGLAKENYCHFTSPIRRYADLVVHRGVISLLEESGAQPHLPRQLNAWAEHLSDTERQSAAAEAEAMRLKVLQYLDDQSQQESARPWRAVVSGVWAHGFALEVDDLQIRGYVPAALLRRRDGWCYLGGRWRRTAGESLEAGSHLWVVPHAVDWETLSVDFRPIEGAS